MLSVEGVYKFYWDAGRKIEVLKGVDLIVGDGEFVGIFGPSGSGKTTLLHIILGIEKPDKGRVLLNGRETSSLKGEEISIIFQEYFLLKDLTVIENIAVPLVIKGESIKKALAKSRDIAEELGLANRINHLPSQLSGGERQRVAIGRALITNPSIILADEPTGSLDKDTEREIMRIFWGLRDKRKLSLIMVSHNRSLFEDFDAVYHLREGVLKKV